MAATVRLSFSPFLCLPVPMKNYPYGFRSSNLARRCLFSLTSAALTLTLASAQVTWVVDDTGGPGVDFTDIDSALAVAGSADVVEVRPGSYGAFTMNSPTRVLGDPGAVVRDQSSIEGIAAGQWTVVSGLDMERLSVRDSSGTVILDDIEFTINHLSLQIEHCADVRGRDIRRSPSGAQRATVLRVDDANVQMTSSSFICTDATNENDGATAVILTSGAFLHLTDCVVEGGRGGDYLPLLFSYVGIGGDGIETRDSSTIRLVRSEIRGGGGGFGDLNSYFDAPAGAGIRSCGGTQEVWASSVEGGFSLGSVLPPGPAYSLGCGASLSNQTPLPSLHQIGPASPGTTLVLEAHADFMSSGRLIFGRFPVRVEVPGSTAPRLVDVGRLASLGAMPLSGVLPIQLNIPAWPRGTVVFLQTSQTIQSDTQMANSVAVVVH